MNTRNLRFRSNRVRDILALFHEELDSIYGHGEVDAFFEILCGVFLHWDKVRLLTSKDQTIDQSDLLRFHWALEDLHHHRPIQHIVGSVDFGGCRIAVGPDVLIPRPETEEMVLWITAQKRHHTPSAILDLCTGSGCIAIALKKAFPKSEVTAVDISDNALEVSRRNAADNGAEVSFLHRDILNDELPPTMYDIIVSNPPYVRDSERVQMARNVLDYEPEMALFVPDSDALRFYKAIAEMAGKRLRADGLLVVEINEALAEETCGVLRGCGFVPSVHDDFRGRHRWISAYNQNHIQ